VKATLSTGQLGTSYRLLLCKRNRRKLAASNKNNPRNWWSELQTWNSEAPPCYDLHISFTNTVVCCEVLVFNQYMITSILYKRWHPASWLGNSGSTRRVWTKRGSQIVGCTWG